ncbi:colicin E5-related ribonuclease [Pseudomonas rubra]
MEPKIADQMGKRGWTESSIQSAIDNPVKAVVTRFCMKTFEISSWPVAA